MQSREVNESIGNGATTLDYLRVRYEWLGQMIDDSEAESKRLREQVANLQKFKDYVHARLDAAGVTVDPESAHKAEGCRIGGRLDEVFAERDRLRLVSAELLAACELMLSSIEGSLAQVRYAGGVMKSAVAKAKGGG